MRNFPVLGPIVPSPLLAPVADLPCLRPTSSRRRHLKRWPPLNSGMKVPLWVRWTTQTLVLPILILRPLR